MNNLGFSFMVYLLGGKKLNNLSFYNSFLFFSSFE